MFNLIITLKNIGDENVLDDFTANIYFKKVSDKKKSDVTISSLDLTSWKLLSSHTVNSGLNIGEITTFSVPLQLLEKGTYEIMVVVDEENITADIDRSNNQDQKITIAVKEEDPVTPVTPVTPIKPETPGIPKTGDGSLEGVNQTNTAALYLIVALALILSVLARRVSRKIGQ
ncbi:CARDB domain-containing protein [Paenibacillus luteus]|uniref:CARDB domain-containing protein n=1 Tax=Paenibacillus luteus TaxID=2545753 RepID=UPI003BA9616E